MDEFDLDEYLKTTQLPEPQPVAAPVIGEPDLSPYDSNIAKATDDAERQRKMSYIMQAMQTMGTANAQSRGMAAPSTKIFEEMRTGAGAPVDAARAEKQAAIKAYLDKKKLDWQKSQADQEERRHQEMLGAKAQENQTTRDWRSAENALTRDNTKALREQTAASQKAKEDEKIAQKKIELEVPGVGYALTPDDAKKLKEGVETKAAFDRKLQELQALREKYGVEYLDREAVARGKQLSKSLLLDYKNLAKLGVLSQSDESIVNAIIPEDPLGQDYAIGQDPILSGIKKLQGDINSDYETTLKTRTRSRFDDTSGVPAAGGGKAPSKNVVKKEVSASTGKTRITYDDGTTEIVGGK